MRLKWTSPRPKKWKVTVLRQLGGIGDLLMTTPVYRGLKEKYGRDCHVTVATSWDYQCGALPLLLRNNPYVDEIVRVEPHTFATKWMRDNKWEFRAVPNEHIPFCVIDTDLVIELSVICAITETKEMREPENVRSHRTDIWCRAANVEPSSKRPILHLTDFELAEGRRWCEEHLGEGKRIGVALRAQSFARTWPYAKEFCADLVRAGYKTVSIDFSERAHDQIPACLGKNIRQTAAIIANLDALITPDTGLLHVAGAVGTPILGIFGSTDGALRMREYAGHYTETKKFVSCGPCWYNYSCMKRADGEPETDSNKHYLCLKRISPRLVMSELETMLERFGPCQPQPASSILTAAR
jgi:ADP-heptose:LPS heptosyltransferase